LRGSVSRSASRISVPGGGACGGIDASGASTGQREADLRADSAGGRGSGACCARVPASLRCYLSPSSAHSDAGRVRPVLSRRCRRQVRARRGRRGARSRSRNFLLQIEVGRNLGDHQLEIGLGIPFDVRHGFRALRVLPRNRSESGSVAHRSRISPWFEYVPPTASTEYRSTYGG